MDEPWYVESFQDDYLKIYAHRTEQAAKEEVQKISTLLAMKPGSRVLDLCCGNGRHSRQLAARGFIVTGVDLSSFLLKEATKKNKGGQITYLEADVRHLPFNEEFDYVLNLFTSFGYFEQESENQKVFTSIYQALKPGGRFLIDFLNPSYVQENLLPVSERNVDQVYIKERRRIEENQVIKQIEIKEEGQEPRYYLEKVRLFKLEEMLAMLLNASLQFEQVFGDFSQSPYDPVKSPRMIIIGKK